MKAFSRLITSLSAGLPGEQFIRSIFNRKGGPAICAQDRDPPSYYASWPFTLALGIPSFTASAQEQSSEPHRIEEVRVVASPIIEGNELDRYASQKTTVSKEQVADLNAQDLASALRKTPGVNISRYNPIGSFGGAEGGGIFIRGQGSSQPGAEIKTLVDGVPMYMSVWNHPLLDLMSIGSAHSVEVYKSPQPQYFGNAYAVVNIVPKRVEKEGVTTRGRQQRHFHRQR